MFTFLIVPVGQSRFEVWRTSAEEPTTYIHRFTNRAEAHAFVAYRSKLEAISAGLAAINEPPCHRLPPSPHEDPPAEIPEHQPGYRHRG